jgi:NADH-quinone oxidoreductase subunit F
MDLHFSADEPTNEEKEAVDQYLGALPPDLPGTRRQYLLPVFHAVQDRIGWISPGALNFACQRLDVPPADAFGVAEFYGLFFTRPQPPLAIHVCDDIGCRFLPGRPVDEIVAELDHSVGHGSAGTSAGAVWHRSPCLGLCDQAPAALMISAGIMPRKVALPQVSRETLRLVLTGEANGGLIPPAMPAPPHQSLNGGGQHLRLLARVGRVDPSSLDDYRASNGFLGLRRAFEMGPDRVIREVTESKLVGRGGAAFPTGQKWSSVRTAPAPHFLVCNADESEPGTFKDRAIMEGDPFALVEAMTIAGFATGCEQGYIYIRGEYPLATQRLQHAIERSRERGYLGKDILGQGVNFDIELRSGAGAYICGEEMALLNSLEGKRGEPRNKPPFPTQVGLFGRPTVINNVETLINVPLIMIGGGKEFAAIGTERSTGTRLFCLSGHVRYPGIYEVPFGTPLRTLLEMAGGTAGSGRLQAILLGGAAGSFLKPDEIDLSLSLEAARAAGVTLGSGVVMLFDDTVDLRETLTRIAQFFRDESCGQCVPCRVGVVRQNELMARLATDRPLDTVPAELKLLAEVGQVMRDASICGLGQTASSAIESALSKFPLFEEKR